jgi:hypothetical protein
MMEINNLFSSLHGPQANEAMQQPDISALLRERKLTPIAQDRALLDFISRSLSPARLVRRFSHYVGIARNPRRLSGNESTATFHQIRLKCPPDELFIPNIRIGKRRI